MRVAICARTRADLLDCAAAVRATGATCHASAADLFDPADCARVVEEAAHALGGLDVLVNNASTGVAGAPASILALTTAHFMERLQGKTLAAIRCAQAAVPHLRRAGGGRIISIGGTAARAVFRGGEITTPSSALPQGLGNASLATFTKYLAEELAPERILVNIVHPHSMHTPRRAARVRQRALESGRSEADVERELTAQIPIGRLIGPEDVAPLVLFLASPWASAITGQTIAVDGGALRNIIY